MQIMAKEDYIIPEKNILPKKEFIGLTDDEIDKTANETDLKFATSADWIIHFARAIEQALRNKND